MVGDRCIRDQQIGAVCLHHILVCGCIRELVGGEQHPVDEHGTGGRVLFDHGSGHFVVVELDIG